MRSIAERCDVPCMCPEYLLMLACYLFPDADDTPGRDVIRLAAVMEMRAIRRSSTCGAR